MAHQELQVHWNERYRTIGAESVSWFAPEPTTALALFDEFEIGPTASVVDVGGGASRLVDHLSTRGHRDLTVVDLSHQALDIAKARAGASAATWVCSDLLEWQPTRRYDVWHDRAAFHFLTEPADRRHYGAALASAISPGGIVVIATFALDGPLMCSGLPVVRYDGPAIEAELGDGFELITSRPEEHHTPSGGSQAFTWTVLRAV